MQLYLLMKTLHIVGAVLFIGNIVVTGWWKAMADRTRDPRIIAFAQRQVSLTDWAFTFSGVVLLGLSGAASALIGGIEMTTPWLKFGTVLFAVSGVIWLAILVPVQMRLAHRERFCHQRDDPRCLLAARARLGDVRPARDLAAACGRPGDGVQGGLSTNPSARTLTSM